ncbi:MAG: hypothetical protein WA125_16785 [Desulfosporosinus sp.]
MKHDGHDNATIGGILSQQERTCEECKRPFIIPRLDLWAYKIVIKGKTHWFCRWNCMRAGERKLKELKGSKGRREELNPNKPTKDELEKDLLQGMTVNDIAVKYNAGKSTVEKWKRDYGLQGIKSKAKENTAVDKPSPTMGLHVEQPTELTTAPPAGRSRPPMTSGVGVAMPDSFAQDIARATPFLKTAIDNSLRAVAQVVKDEALAVTMEGNIDTTQASPTLTEIEQFHTDTEAQELPVVEMDSVILDASPELSEPQPDKPLAITMEPVTPITPKTDKDWSDEFPILTKEYAQKLRDENLSSKLTDPTPRTSDETINDIFRDLNAVLFKLEGVYVNNAIADAQKLFRGRLRDELADWVGESR